MPRKPSSPKELPYQANRFERFFLNHKWKLVVASFVLMLALGFVGNYFSGQEEIRRDRQSTMLQSAHGLGLALYSYAQDHNGKYPEGKSSTEIFQQLIDQGYVTDPAIFYFLMAGKTRATSNKLKPENVCWDMTGGVLPTDSDDLPLVFITGFKVDYTPGGKAHPLVNSDTPGIVVFYKNDSAMVVVTNGTTPLIAPTFDPKGRKYQQLTPDGPLP